MRKIIFFIISAMALVFLVNISAFSSDNKIKIESSNGIIELNPIY